MRNLRYCKFPDNINSKKSFFLGFLEILRKYTGEKSNILSQIVPQALNLEAAGQQDPLQLGEDCTPCPLLLRWPGFPPAPPGSLISSSIFFRHGSEESVLSNLHLNHCGKKKETGSWDNLLLGTKSWRHQGFCQGCLPLLFRLSLSRNNVYIARVHYCQLYFLCAFSCRKWPSFLLRENISILGCYFHDTALCRVLPEIFCLREKIGMSFTATEKMHCCFST